MSHRSHNLPDLSRTGTYNFCNIPIRKHVASGYTVDHVKNSRAEIIKLIHVFKDRIG
ncbi:Hypothetical protein Cul131001_0144 [Corynebacterium ulcerans]|uniref:Uncharacterized protein n=1 Tax=Corynebacterium ulcerans FRC58 TaxID=1408268 RepID=A0ABN4GQQ5_CORUL|nr:Hypothetical protein Cul05146_0140 [Corynebacterium ulcerans]AKN75990.1 Hypothetical protein CulFRC58_0136 [Corynebacterium ulcerans FRC58]ALD93884.1 Hypothetical protein Cul131001_0144 [Corynebacterium ulcerans]